MKLSQKLTACILAAATSATISIPAFATEKTSITTGSVTSGTLQFEQDLVTRRINSTEDIEWIQIAAGSQGGADSSFFHPTDPNYVYISQNMDTSYMSRDGMTSVDTWETISDEDANGGLTALSQTYQMKFSLQDENYGLAANENGLFVTYDKGKNWRPFAEDKFPHIYSQKVSLSALTIDPTNHDIIYAGSGGFWKNKDPRTSKQRYKTGASNGAVQGIIYKSTDGGVTWTNTFEGLPRQAEIGQIFIHPKQRDTLYVATSHGNFISHNGGASYEPINDGLADPITGDTHIRDLAFHYDEATDQVTLVTATLTIWDLDDEGNVSHTSGGVFKSVDEGKTWESLNDGMMVDYTNFKDANGKGSQQGFQTGIGNWFGKSNLPNIKVPDAILPSFREVEINPVNPNILYAVNCGRKENSIEPEGIWISEDGGKNWFISTRIGSGYQEDAEYWSSQYAPDDVDLTTRNVDVGGEEDWSWMFDGQYPMLAYQYLAISPDGKTLITHVFKSRIVSKDGGRTWAQVDSVEVDHDIWIGRGNSNVPGKYVLTQPVTNDVYFVSGETGLWKLNDTVDYSHIDTKAVPMERIDFENQVSCPGAAVAFHPHDPNTVYALVDRLGHRGEFVKSTNGGKDWESLSKVFDVPMSDSIKAYTLIIDKNDPNTMYFAVPVKTINDVASKLTLKAEQRGVYKTTDGGVTWAVANNGIDATPANINAVAFSTDHETLYAASMGADGGLYKSIDEAENWTKMPLPAGVNSVNDITVAPSGRIVISTGFAAGTPATCKGGMWYSDDNGSTWTHGFSGAYIIDTTVDPKDENRMVVTMGGSTAINGLNQGLFMTTDGGASWVKINNGIGNSNKTTEVMFDPIDPNVMWASSYASGFYKMVLPDAFSSADQVMTTEDFSLPVALPVPNTMREIPVTNPTAKLDDTHSLVNLANNGTPIILIDGLGDIIKSSSAAAPVLEFTTIDNIEEGSIVSLNLKFQEGYFLKNSLEETNVTVHLTNNPNSFKNIDIVVPSDSLTFMADKPLEATTTLTLKFAMPNADVDIVNDLQFHFDFENK
ncbi:sialidase family protein [Candidatus Epulonipiscium viviparus]|uniref:sialidase family protein n=1 Tax=Candidatus Epulonipiscium viviparus TaxID=420336 RepID=UPI00016C0B4E|nr:sialidase family protein [Candidatus Epulopiscium viviparus]